MQNAMLAPVMASAVLKEDAMAVPGAGYGVLMHAGGLAFAFGVRRFTGTLPQREGVNASATI